MTKHPHRLMGVLTLAVMLIACAGSVAPTVVAPTLRPQVPTSAPPATTAPTDTGLAPTVEPLKATPSGPGDFSRISIALKPWLTGLDEPLDMVSANDQSGRLFIVQRAGTIAVAKDHQLLPNHFLDISDRIRSSYNEQGLLGLAFHPQYAQNGYFFVYYNDLQGSDTLSRFSVSSNPDLADPASEQVLLKIPKRAPNHNGGMLIFGPDGDLYLGPGDGGSQGDPNGNGQNPATLLGKILRINVDSLPYTIPADNPYVNQAGARPEVWAIGLRNPWRFTFDRLTGDLYIADVGQNAYEEIDFQPAGSPGGLNYGWSRMEGMHCYPESAACGRDGLVLPVAEYNHDDGCAVVGGYIYRGSQFPDLSGVYFFGDNCSGNLWGMIHAGDGSWQVRRLLSDSIGLSSFAEDPSGEVFALGLNGSIYQIVDAGP